MFTSSKLITGHFLLWVDFLAIFQSGDFVNFQVSVYTNILFNLKIQL